MRRNTEFIAVQAKRVSQQTTRSRRYTSTTAQTEGPFDSITVSDLMKHSQQRRADQTTFTNSQAKSQTPR
jgi:hypothetical protein